MSAGATLAPVIDFRLMQAGDLDLLGDWLRRPHVREWWQDTPVDLHAEFLAPGCGIRPYIALVDGRPLGFVQGYSVMAVAGDGWWEDEADPGARGMDQFIADVGDLDRRLGRQMVRAFVEHLFRDPAATRVQVDPSPQNARAIRCYLAAGFKTVGECDTPDGRALLMYAYRDDFVSGMR